MALPFRLVAGLPDRRAKKARVLYINDNEELEWRGTDLGEKFVVTDYGAVGDGLTDNRSKIQDALDACEAAGGGTVYFPKGVYAIKQPTIGDVGLTVASNVTLEGYGAELDFGSLNATTAFGATTSPCILVEGSVSGTGLTLANTYAAGVDSLVFSASAATDFAENDLVQLSSSVEVDNQPIAELHRIKSINGTTVTLYETTVHAFEATTGVMKKVTPVTNVNFRGLIIRGPGRDTVNTTYGAFGIIFRYCENVFVEDTKLIDCDQTAIDFQSCNIFGCNHVYMRFSNPGANVNVQYGIKVSNASCHGIIQNSHCDGAKHAFLTGHTTIIPGFARNCTFRRCTAVGCWHTGIITHKASTHLDFVDCQVMESGVGINVRSPRCRIKGCHIQGATHGILLSELADECHVSDNHVEGSSTSGINVSSIDSGHRPNRMVFTNNVVYSNTIGFNINVAADDDDPMVGWALLGNTVKTVSGRSLNMIGNVSILIHGNMMNSGGTERGIRAFGIQQSMISGNWVSCGTTATISIEDSGTAVADHNVVRENFVSGGTVNAVYFGGATGTKNVKANNYILDSEAMDS